MTRTMAKNQTTKQSSVLKSTQTEDKQHNLYENDGTEAKLLRYNIVRSIKVRLSSKKNLAFLVYWQLKIVHKLKY